MSAFAFTELLARTQAELVAQLGLRPLPLPAELCDPRGQWRGEPVALRARAFCSAAVPYARFVSVQGKGLEIANLLCVPKAGEDVPLFGADLVGLGAERGIVVVDLSPTARDGAARDRQEALVAAQRVGGCALPSGGEPPAWCQDWLSPNALHARVDAAQAPSVGQALEPFTRAFVALVSAASARPAGGRERQLAYFKSHREDDKGLGLLAKLFHAQLAERLIHEVLFPVRLPEC